MSELLKQTKGKITDLWKRQERDFDVNLEFGKYKGTKLYVDLTIYNPIVFEINNRKYGVPRRISVDCYKSVQDALNSKAFGRAAIFEKDIIKFRSKMIGKKVEISFVTAEDLISVDGTLPVVVSICDYKINGKEGAFTGIIDICPIEERGLDNE